ncbi:hypothetical protein LTR56_004099 [Elasticomyces elasticus]|nr:hypothetical protein LTR56_004099 [Elasticomyces elasticus]KAK3661338.1 hypothetical protein LTR22_007545 [Elasticomyces elasticus]KAK5765367.1 hypothetical protein LTS12_004380 [Elasticomyces elasticus]
MYRSKKRNILPATKRVAEDNKAIHGDRSYESNATLSPLLRLPPEVRNRIWRYLMCGNTIHVEPGDLVPVGTKLVPSWKLDPRKLPFRAGLCRSTTSTSEHVALIKAYQTSEPRDCQRITHPDCLDDDSRTLETELGLSILKTCRQAHQEAALLPFASNHFYFSCGAAVINFVRYILLHQARTIRSMSLVIGHRFDYLHAARHLLKSKLRGLQHLSCIVQLTAPYVFVGAIKTRFARHLSVFVPSPLLSALVAVYCVKQSYWRMKPPARLLDAMGGWETEVQERLLAKEEDMLESAVSEHENAGSWVPGPPSQNAG